MFPISVFQPASTQREDPSSGISFPHSNFYSNTWLLLPKLPILHELEREKERGCQLPPSPLPETKGTLTRYFRSEVLWSSSNNRPTPLIYTLVNVSQDFCHKKTPRRMCHKIFAFKFTEWPPWPIHILRRGPTQGVMQIGIWICNLQNHAKSKHTCILAAGPHTPMLACFT
jgi:hypothetical protein